MKKILLAAALSALAVPAYAQTAAAPAAIIDDPLHLCYSTGCSAFGGVTISTLGGSGLSGFGVSSSPAPQTGTLYFALLVPDNETETVLPTLSGTLNGNPIAGIGSFIPEGTFGSGTDLTAQANLKAALGGLGASPPNPFSAYSGATLLEDPSFDGLDYSVFLVKVGTITTGTAAGQTSTLDNSFTLSGGDYLSGLNTLTGVGPGAIITAFMVETGVDNKGNPTVDLVSTAQSSSLLVTPSSAPPVPEPGTWAMLISGFALMGLFGWRKRTARYAL
jgi:hypothetical protein